MKRRPLIGIVLAISVHVALWFTFSASGPALLTHDPESSLVMFLVPRPESKVVTMRDIKLERPRLKVPVSKPRRKDTSSAIIPFPATTSLQAIILVPEHAEDESMAPRLDIEALKRSVGKMDLGDIGKPAKAARGQSIEDKIAAGVNKATVPKCDNDYNPQMGSVKFTGLLKLPFLAKAAITKTDCKW
jgi:hypothetical protein